MRVTQSMLQNNMLQNLFKSQENMNKYLTQINTGKKISRPSEDPVVAMKGMNYRTQITEIEQYTRNTSEGWTWMENSDDSMDRATKVMQRMEYLAVQAANGTYSEDERKSIYQEVNQLKEQLIEIANTNVNGKYIFNGTDTDVKPIETDENGELIFNMKENPFPVEIEVAKGIKLPVNISPENIFNEQLFQEIDQFMVALETNDSEGIQAGIAQIQDGSQGFIDARAELGARMNRLELIEDRLEKQGIMATSSMAENEGVDFEEAVTNLLTQEVIHRAALAAGSKIIQPSLLDFLR